MRLIYLILVFVLVGCETVKKTSRYDVAFDYLIKNEGGYVDNPKDPGGETKYGICKRYNKNINIKNITLEFAKKYYYEKFWSSMYERIHDSKIAIKLFDTSVNIGKEPLKILINEALLDSFCYPDKSLMSQLKAVTITDKILKKPKDWEDFVINSINKTNSNLFLNIFKAKLINYYCSLVRKNNNLANFKRNWIKRAAQ